MRFFFAQKTPAAFKKSAASFRLDIRTMLGNNSRRSRTLFQKGSAMARKPSDELLADFMGRLQFLETMWGCKTSFDVDTETGRGWLEIRMPDSQAVLRINRIHVGDVLIPAENGHKPAAQ